MKNNKEKIAQLDIHINEAKNTYVSEETYPDTHCAIDHSGECMQNPAIIGTGHSFEYENIYRWLVREDKDIDPLTNTRLKNKKIILNHALKNTIDEISHVNFRKSCAEKTEKSIQDLKTHLREAKVHIEYLMGKSQIESYYIFPTFSWPLGLYCPLTLALFKDPVITSDGMTYEREAIEAWVDKYHTDPFTHKPLSKQNLFPNINLKKTVEKLKEMLMDRDEMFDPASSQTAILDDWASFEKYEIKSVAHESYSLSDKHKIVFVENLKLLRSLILQLNQVNREIAQLQNTQKRKRKAKIALTTAGIITGVLATGYYLYSSCSENSPSENTLGESSTALTSTDKIFILDPAIVCVASRELLKYVSDTLNESTFLYYPRALINKIEYLWSTQQADNPSEKMAAFLRWYKKSSDTLPRNASTIQVLEYYKNDLIFLKHFFQYSLFPANETYKTDFEKFIINMSGTDASKIAYLEMLFKIEGISSHSPAILYYLLKLNQKLEPMNTLFEEFFLKRDIKSLSEKHAFKAKDHLGQTILHLAVLDQNRIDVDALLKLPDVDINAVNNDGMTPLALAVKQGELKLVKKLIEKKADFHKPNLLKIAVENNHLTIAEMFFHFYSTATKPALFPEPRYIKEAFTTLVQTEKPDFQLLKFLIVDMMQNNVPIDAYLIDHIPKDFWRVFPNIAGCFGKSTKTCRFKPGFWTQTSASASQFDTTSTPTDIPRRFTLTG